MRTSPRAMRHSSWSLFLVPLTLPLVLLCMPGARSSVDRSEGAATVQEQTLDDDEMAPQDTPTATPKARLRSQAFPAETDSLRHARLPESALLKS